MERDEILKEFRDADALLEGHFVLSSGLHSPVYLQCAKVMMDAARGGRLCAALAAGVRKVLPDMPEVVVSPAMGGVIVGYEMGRQLGIPSMFTERVDGTFTFRRGFGLEKGTRVLMVEDVVTTGLSSRECMDCIRDHGGRVVGAASLVDRSNGSVRFDVPYTALLPIDAPTYEAGKLPDWLAAMPEEKPGSRSLKPA